MVDNNWTSSGGQSVQGEAVGKNRSLSSLWATEQSRFNASRRRIAECGRWRRREAQPVLPEGWSNPDSFSVQLPYATTLGQDIVNFLSRKEIALQRQPLGVDQKAQRTATKIEQWANAAFEQLRSNGEVLWDSFLAHAVNDGEFAVLVSPRPAHWASILDFTTTVDGEEMIAPQFRRDSQGRSADDLVFKGNAKGFVIDKKKSAAAYDEYARDAKARRLPFVVRVIPASMCLPLGIDPQTGKVDAMLVRSERSVMALQRDGIEVEIQGAALPAPGWGETFSGGAHRGAGTVVTLYELWGPGFVEYEVQGPLGSTTNTKLRNRDGELENAVINLGDLYGLTEVPGGYFWGAHNPAEPDPNNKGLPVLWAYLHMLAGLNQVLTAEVAHTYATAFGGWFANPLGNQGDIGLWEEMGRPTSIEVKPFAVNMVPGEVKPATHPGTGPGAQRFVELGMQVMQQSNPVGKLTDNTEASGFGQGIHLASLDAMLNQCLSGAVQAVERVAECLLEQAAALSESTGAPIPVYAHTSGKGKKQDHVEISANDLMGDFEIEPFFPQVRGSNLPLAQAGSAWVEKGMISHRTWLTDMWGETDPDHEEDLIWVEKQLNSPQGQQLTLQLAAQHQGNSALAKMHQLAQQGKVAPGGTPKSAIPPRPAPPQPPLPGPSLPSPLISPMAHGIGAPQAPVPPMNLPGRPGNAPGQANPAIRALGGISAGADQTAAMNNLVNATGTGAPIGTP